MTVVTPVGEMLVTSTCWSCGVRLAKAVRLHWRPKYVGWSCQRCDVRWAERTVPPR